MNDSQKLLADYARRGSAARKRVSRAVEKLHENLTRQGVTLSAAGLGAALGAGLVVSAPAGLVGEISGAAFAAAGGGGTAAGLKILAGGKIKLTLVAAALVAAAGAIAIFDGKTLNGWEGNTNNWRVEDGAIVAGSLDRKQPHNEFLATTREFGNFELRLQYKVEGTNGFVNGGVQFWSRRVPNNFEVSGYQADLGADTDGNLYDESRRNRNLVAAEKATREKVLKPGDWNNYRIRAEGAHIQLWLNGVKTVDYTESDPTIPRRGIIALQIHGGASTKVQYRDLEIEELP